MAQSVTPQYSLTMRVRLPNGAGSFARVAGAIGKAGGVLAPSTLSSPLARAKSGTSSS